MPNPPILTSSILSDWDGSSLNRGLNFIPLSINSNVNVGGVYSTLTVTNSVFE